MKRDSNQLRPQNWAIPNGRNELLLISMEMQMGYEHSMVQMLEFNGNHLSRLGAWKVSDSDCSGSMTCLSKTVLKVKPGQRFKILGDVYKGNCQTQKRVSRDKPVAPFEMYNPEILAAPTNGT